MESNKEVSQFLSQLAFLKELNQDNSFSIRAINQGASTIKKLDAPYNELLDKGKLSEIKGIGKGIVSLLKEYKEKGTSNEFQALLDKYGENILELYQLPGIGPKKIKVLVDELEIHSLDELEYACKENRLSSLKGFGEKSQDKVLEGIEFVKKNRGKILLATGYHLAMEMKEQLLHKDNIKEVWISGQVRRGEEIINQLDFILLFDKNKQELKPFIEKEWNVQVKQDQNKSTLSFQHQYSVGVVFHLFEDEQKAIWHYWKTTGSNDHISIIEKKLNGKQSFKSEADIYSAAKLSYIPAEMRHGSWEIPLAEKNDIPELIKIEDIQGTFHNHTNQSDGRKTLEEMAQGAKNNGYSFFAITDHSKSAFYANGLDADRLHDQFKQIDEFNKNSKDITLLKGTEVDILKDGTLDFPDELLDECDVVVASVHSSMKMDSQSMTKRIVKAVSNPKVHILGHPTGRIILGRESYGVDINEVLKAAKDNGTIMELNANSHRLDLNWENLLKAKEMGIKIAISPDAHSLSDLDQMIFGILTARRAGLTKKDCLNTYSLKEIQSFLNK